MQDEGAVYFIHVEPKCGSVDTEGPATAPVSMQNSAVTPKDRVTQPFGLIDSGAGKPVTRQAQDSEGGIVEMTSAFCILYQCLFYQWPIMIPRLSICNVPSR